MSQRRNEAHSWSAPDNKGGLPHGKAVMQAAIQHPRVQSPMSGGRLAGAWRPRAPVAKHQTYLYSAEWVALSVLNPPCQPHARLQKQLHCSARGADLANQSRRPSAHAVGRCRCRHALPKDPGSCAKRGQHSANPESDPEYNLRLSRLEGEPTRHPGGTPCPTVCRVPAR